VNVPPVGRRLIAVQRIGAVVRADVLTRVRRSSSVAILVILCILSYHLVPPVSSGRTMLLVDGHRALLTSSATALATASMASVLLAMLGFYLVSNAVRRDTTTRVGTVIAAMPVRNAEYLLGKFLGNATFLGLIAFGYMLNVMVLHLLRAEGPLQPVTYLSTYLIVLGPSILITAALALLFECVQPISGRVGDVLYLVVWGGMVSLTALDRPGSGLQWFHFVDPVGMLFTMRQISPGSIPHAAAVGGMPFDPRSTPWAFPGIQWSAVTLVTRLSSAFLALPLLLVAKGFFSRFDPALTKQRNGRGPRHLPGQLHRILRPVTQLLLRGLSPAPDAAGFGRIIRGEVIITFLLSPFAVVFVVAIATWGWVASRAALQTAVLPLTFLGIVIVITDIVTRDAQSGMVGLLYSAPRVKSGYLITKFAAASAIATLFVTAPLVRLAVLQPTAALSLGIGTVFAAALATSLGYLTGSGKAFAGFFLLFLYLVRAINTVPAFDFAGWNGVATGGVQAGYATAAVALISVSVLHHRWALR
jgi:hypothetical protein